MNIQNLRYFVIVAKLENVSRAAEIMHTSQSSISKIILGLEDELGTKLFDRHGRKLVLNEAGKRFLESCENILQETDSAIKDLKHMSIGGDDVIRIRAIGIEPHLLACMSMFRLSYPSVEYIVDTLPEKDEIPDINAYDLIIYPDEVRYSKFKGFGFYTEKYLFAVRVDHPMAGRLSLPVSMMNDLPYVFIRHGNIYEYPFHVCTAQNVSMKSVNYVDSQELHRQMIANGIAVGFVPEGSTEIYRSDSRIKLLHLTDSRFQRRMNACFKREKHLSEMASAFKKYFIDYYNIQVL
ncbi:MAG: LysR family transcriptional regulator [Mogibacterium sp.]|nr:LysR family transcriptional regulator [Mogibacterium sp.]MBR2539275.1 LysR family transcriptional regulator [Mogibacterium sp.]